MADGERRAKPRKSDVTRAHIVDTALRLFRERGYEGTTMRAIAEEAGVSVGNAYYYFRSKDQLVQAYYGQITDAYAERARDVFARERDFEARLAGVMAELLEVIAPYQPFAGALFRSAADPASPLSPFSPESEPARATSTAMYRELVDGSDAKMSRELREELPHLLWLYHMGVVLFWVHDRSPGLRRTHELVDQTVPVIASLVGMSRLPVLRPIARQLVRTATSLREFVTDDGTASAPAAGEGPD